MVFGKKLGIGCLAMIAVFAIPPFLYGLISDSDKSAPWVTTLSVLLFILVGVGLLIYLAVDAAIRHNRDR